MNDFDKKTKLSEPKIRENLGNQSSTGKHNLDHLAKLTAQETGSVKIGSSDSLWLARETGLKYPSIRLFPSFTNALVWLIGLTAITVSIRLIGPGLADYWIALPFQIYWSYWLFSISYACGQRYKTAPPINALEIGLISCLSFILLPLVNNYHFNRLIDPLFYLWLLILACAPLRIGRFLDWQENKTAKGISGIGLAAGAIALPLYTAFIQNASSDLIDLSLGLGFSWFFAQFSWMSYAVLKLSGRLDPAAIANQTSKNKVYAGTDIVIRYRAFPELERWCVQKFAAKHLAKGMRLFMMWFAGPALVIISVLGLNALIFGFMSIPYAEFHGWSPESGAAVGAANLSFIFKLIMALVSVTLGVLTVMLIQPTHLALGEKGVRLLWRNQILNLDGQYLAWNKLTNIYIEHLSKQASTVFDKLCFRETNNQLTKIRLNAIDSFEDKEMLLNAIRTWAPKISRDARVIESLQPPADYSYTELWLQALSAPPKRERFKPLVEGALVKNARYQVIASLGSGGQGFAYLAKDCPNQSEVVLKEFILPVYVDISVRKSALEQFENEARILRQLDNPQIVKLLDFFVEDHRAYLVLEHINGSSLRSIVERNGPLTEKDTIALASQMCDVLVYMHSQTPPVVHRDFTPDNLILGRNSILKLIDFNVAQNTESTTTGTVVGKPAYLPPEQFRGTPTAQSDIYAMGATLYFLLTGSDPKPISVSHPIEKKPEISPALDQIISRATDLDTTKRYANIGELNRELQALS